ncbi:MAG: accessory gene regulator B family protein [Terrisporobacter sp.]|uniref:accessory gene regulator ArgB-like protein n=1 Tax=Terrisporobacter sp. TaxID=1965305 RepID=UPI002FC5AE87
MESLTETISSKLALYIGENTNKSGEELEVLKYGIFIFMHIFIAVVFTFIFGLITNTLFEILIISLIGGLMKRCCGGVHSSSPNRCIITGIIVSYGFSLIGKNIININGHIIYLIVGLMLIHSFFIIYKKCPVPSKNKPLKKEETRKKLRKKAFKNFFICTIGFILSMFYTNLNYLAICMVLGLYMQSISLTAIGTKVILLIDKLLIKVRV